MDNVQNKRVMITGAANGLGYKYAEILLRNGAKCVAIVDLLRSNGQDAIASFDKKFGKGRSVFYPCDVTKAEDFEKTFKKIVDALHGLDIIINNAGILNDRLFDQTIDINIKAVIRGSLLALDHMGKHKNGEGGVIVNIASILGLAVVNSSLPIYSATKHAVVGFSQNLAEFYNNTGVRVLTMCPGVTLTSLVKDVKDKVLDFVTEEDLAKMRFYPTQTTDNVAAAMLDLICKGKNGDVWVSEDEKPPYAVDFPHYSKRSLPV